MRYLLDASVLIALGVIDHQAHGRVESWQRSQVGRSSDVRLLTCAITELAFVRILSQPVYGSSVAEALSLLKNLKRSGRSKWEFIPDDRDATHLPVWVRSSQSATNGHLLDLAQAHQAQLATLDERIPGAFVIPAR